MQALALDIGGTHIGCGVVQDQRLLAHSSLEFAGAARLADVLPLLEEALRTLLHEAGTTVTQCAGIAVGFPGIVDARTGTIHSTLKKYEDAPALDLPGWAQARFGIPMRIENDARMALLGESFAGAAQGIRDVVMMTLGTGIGTAAILEGRLLRGVHAHAGCLGGHLTAEFNGRPCTCGNVGCAEAEASGWSMPLVAGAWPGIANSSLATLPHIGFRELFAHAEQHDEVAQAVLLRCLRVWSANAVSLIHAYDPEILILGGGVMRSAEPIVSFMQDYINKQTWSSWGKTQVKTASLGNAAALLGAIPLLTEEKHGTQTELR